MYDAYVIIKIFKLLILAYVIYDKYLKSYDYTLISTFTKTLQKYLIINL